MSLAHQIAYIEKLSTKNLTLTFLPIVELFEK